MMLSCHDVVTMSFLVWGYVGGMQPCCAGICVDARLFAAMRGDNVCSRLQIFSISPLALGVNHFT